MFWPLLLYLLPRERALVVILFGLPALTITSALVVSNTLEILVADSLLYRGTNFRMRSLCIGSALAFHEVWARALRPRILVVLLFAIVPLAVLAAHLHSTAIGTIIISNFIWKLLLYALASLCSLLVALGFSSAGQMPIKIALCVISDPTTRFFGHISFGLHLYHYPILFSLGLLDDTTVISRTKAAMLAGILVAVPTLSWYVIEAPLLRWKDRLTVR